MKCGLVPWILGSAVSAAVTVGAASPGLSQDVWSLSCGELWYQRNSIFKDAGYCFHTPRAIRAFGNAGCSYDDERAVPLSDNDRSAINSIREVENAKGCSQ